MFTSYANLISYQEKINKKIKRIKIEKAIKEVMENPKRFKNPEALLEGLTYRLWATTKNI